MGVSTARIALGTRITGFTGSTRVSVVTWVAACTTGYAVGTPFTNLIFDLTGTYRNVSIVYGVLMLVIAVVFQIILTKTNKIKAAVIAQEKA